ncbi:hypothetical protein X975_08247, partial [Stegodyphus mimosarum]
MLLKLEYNSLFYVHVYVDLGFLYWNARDIFNLLPTKSSHTYNILQVFFPDQDKFLQLGELYNYSKEWGSSYQIVLTSNEAAYVAQKAFHNELLFPWMCQMFMEPLTKDVEDGKTYIVLRDTVEDEAIRRKSPIFFLTQDPRQSNVTEAVPQRKQQEPAIMASKRQKKKAPPQQSRRNKNQKCGLKRKTADVGEQTYVRTYEQTKRRKQNGQGKPKVAKRTAETSERCLRSKQPRLQVEDQRPECSRNQEQR